MRLVVALAVLALAAGCGSDGGGDIDQARDAVSDYFTAIAEGDGARACGRMTEQAQQQFADQGGSGSCEEAVERLSEQLPDQDLAPLRDPQVDVTLNRDKATASVEDGPSDITVVKVDGGWLIDAD
jgi:hypothetical protein